MPKQRPPVIYRDRSIRALADLYANPMAADDAFFSGVGLTPRLAVGVIYRRRKTITTANTRRSLWLPRAIPAFAIAATIAISCTGLIAQRAVAHKPGDTTPISSSSPTPDSNGVQTTDPCQSTSLDTPVATNFNESAVRATDDQRVPCWMPPPVSDLVTV